MKPIFNLKRVDIDAFARRGGTFEIVEPLSGFARVVADAVGGVEGLSVQARGLGEARPQLGGGPQIWLHLQLQAVVPLLCQRCLGRVEIPVEVDRWFRFAADESIAERLDDEVEEDVLVLSKDFDLHALIEDELLLALPIVPKHEQCPVDVPFAVVDPDFEAAQAERPRPFDVLAQWTAGKK